MYKLHVINAPRDARCACEGMRVRSCVSVCACVSAFEISRLNIIIRVFAKSTNDFYE